MKISLFPDQDYTLSWLLMYVRHALDKARSKELRSLGLRITPEQAAVLFVVKATGPKVTPAEISRWLLREPHTVSSLLDRMEKAGLLRKVRDLERKNMVRVVLTRKGQQVYLKSSKREVYHRVMSSLSKKERQQLGSYLIILLDKVMREFESGYQIPFPFPSS